MLGTYISKYERQIISLRNKKREIIVILTFRWSYYLNHLGAYKSDAVAYVRARPVVKATVSTRTTPRLIDLKSTDIACDASKRTTCLGLETCVQYYGKSVPAKLTMQVDIELDIDHVKSTAQNQRVMVFSTQKK